MSKFDARVFLTALRLEAGDSTNNDISLAQLRQLLKQPGEIFLKQAYRVILGREADVPGLRAYTPRAQIWPGRALILLSLYLSPERILLPPWLRKTIKLGSGMLKKNQGEPL